MKIIRVNKLDHVPVSHTRQKWHFENSKKQDAELIKENDREHYQLKIYGTAYLLGNTIYWND